MVYHHKFAESIIPKSYNITLIFLIHRVQTWIVAVLVVVVLPRRSLDFDDDESRLIVDALIDLQLVAACWYFIVELIFPISCNRCILFLFQELTGILGNSRTFRNIPDWQRLENFLHACVSRAMYFIARVELFFYELEHKPTIRITSSNFF